MEQPPSSAGINMLLDQLCNAEDNARQLQSFQQVNYIQLALGEARTLGELVPFLAQLIEGQDDEVVMGISKAGLSLVHDYYLTFSKKNQNMPALALYLQRLSVQLLHSIYLPVLNIQDSLIAQQALSDIKAILSTVFMCCRMVKSPSPDLTKKTLGYQQAVHEFVMKLLSPDGKPSDSQIQVQAGVMTTCYYLGQTRQDSNDILFRVLSCLLDRLPSDQSRLVQSSAKLILDGLQEASMPVDGIVMHSKYIEQIVHLANRLIKMDVYSVKINFMPLFMNCLVYCQNEPNHKSVLDALLGWLHTLTRQHSQPDTLNENKLQQYQVTARLAEIYQISMQCQFKALKETVIQKVIQEVEQNTRPQQVNSNNSNYNQNVIDTDEQGLQGLLAGQIKGIASSLAQQKEPQEGLDVLIKQLKVLMGCETANVKCQVADCLMTMTYCYSTKKDIIDNILPLFLQLLRDQSPEVKVKLLKKINPLSQKLGLEMLQQSILPAISDLAQETNWRIKDKLIRMFIYYAKEIKTGAEIVQSQAVKKVVLDFFQDKVYAVRNSMANHLAPLGKLMGPAWTESVVKSLVEQQRDSHSYQLRITLIRALVSVSSFTCLSRSFFLQRVLPPLDSLKKDLVTNVRHNLALHLRPDPAHDFLGPDNDKVKSILKHLSTDTNCDVKEAALASLK